MACLSWGYRAVASEPFDTIEAAIETVVEAEGLTLLRYEGDAVPKLPIATLVPDSVEPQARGYDQEFVVGSVTYTLRIYNRMSKDPRLAWDDAKAQVRNIFDALGADRSLSGAVSSVDIERTTFEPVVAVVDGQRELMVEIQLSVVPRYVA